MKDHAIIPVFIPHQGCPHSCVFCNQKAITAKTCEVFPGDVEKIANIWLSTLENSSVKEIELSFFGGSFTGIPIEQQSAFLSVARRYKEQGRINKIHLSTRPDYIDEKILDNLKAYKVDVIELGVQSFDPKVLELSERGHSTEQVYKACTLIKEYGFTLGIQLMIGLPGDSYKACMDSVEKTVNIKPQIARIYPTVIISDTKLARMYEEGSYKPFSLEETLHIAKDMYIGLTKANINVIRVGLKSSDLINDGENSKVLGNSYHPAFRQLLEGEIARDKIEKALQSCSSLRVRAGTKAFGNVIGHKACNKKYFLEKYPDKKIIYVSDKNLEDLEMLLEENP